MPKRGAWGTVGESPHSDPTVSERAQPHGGHSAPQRQVERCVNMFPAQIITHVSSVEMPKELCHFHICQSL